MKNIKQEKKRMTVVVDDELLRKINASTILDGSATRTEFVIRALEFYIGMLSTKNNQSFLGQIIGNMMDGIVADSENRIARLLFKEAVELAKLTQVIAYACDVDEDTIQSLHRRCVNEVKRINGSINFEDAYRFQKTSDTDGLV